MKTIGKIGRIHHYIESGRNKLCSFPAPLWFSRVVDYRLHSSSSIKPEMLGEPIATLRLLHYEGLMSSRPEIGNKSKTQNNAENEGFAESQGNEVIPAGFPVGPWDDSAIISDNI
ncbi:hypothetical protein JHK87_025003 [Glycine soja]|nr:hypothetical protein JHK87_025003 [Glycine soja]